MKRRPEPELMDSEAQTAAYADADFSESNTLFTERFTSRFPGLPGRGLMVDLGCGPGRDLMAFKTANYFPAAVRGLISDFAVIIARLLMTGLDFWLGKSLSVTF